MSASSTPPILPGEMPRSEVGSTFARFRDSVADSLFFVSRTFPKVLTLRSSPSAWTGFRILLGIAGAALGRSSAQFVERLGIRSRWLGAVSAWPCSFRRCARIAAARKPSSSSAPTWFSTAETFVRELTPFKDSSDDEPCAVNFYLTPTRVWALDSQLRPLAVIPANEISMATAFPSQSDWILRVRWQENSAEFIFDGLFAERRARLAEAGLRHLIQQKEHSPAARARAKAAGA